MGEQNFEFDSAIRQKADEDGIFEKAILREVGEGLDQSLLANLKVFDQYQEN